MEALKNRATMHLHIFDKHSYAITFANSIKKEKISMSRYIFFVGQRVLQNATFLSVSWKVQQSAHFVIAPLNQVKVLY